MGPEGFQLSVTLSEVHLPRMWVENHPVKDSQVCSFAFSFFSHTRAMILFIFQPSGTLLQACMLVFYPDFDVNSSSASDEVVLLLDTSESMKGESLHMAQKISLQVLETLESNLRLNVILFGTGQFYPL